MFTYEYHVPPHSADGYYRILGAQGEILANCDPETTTLGTAILLAGGPSLIETMREVVGCLVEAEYDDGNHPVVALAIQNLNAAIAAHEWDGTPDEHTEITNRD